MIIKPPSPELMNLFSGRGKFIFMPTAFFKESDPKDLFRSLPGKFFLIMTMIFGMNITVFGQHQEIGEKPEIWKKDARESIDSNSLFYAFKNGKASGHLRYFFMATDNEEGLSDYYAHAAGGGLKFETAKYKGFQLGISGFFTFNLGSSSFLKPDAKTGQFSRYEIGLFDIEDPSNKSDIDRLEELYLKYSFQNSSITAGKQLINNPFINLQDGRMRPTEVNGVWLDHQTKKTRIEGGVLYQISPRGTVRWYGVGESIGVYSTGININGTKSEYKGNTHTKGIAMIGINHKPINNLSFQFWHIYTENIFNASFLQTEFEKEVRNKHKLSAGIQLLQQFRIGEGGNKENVKKYMQDQSAFSFGGKLGWQHLLWKASFNFNRITRQGRYTMPREWGRDPFYTFMPRERNEGLANVYAYVIKVNKNFPKQNLNTSLSLGHFKLPSVYDFAANKYGLPSYNQLNIDLRHKFKGQLSGLEAQLLYVYKRKANKQTIEDKFIINRVNMSLWNLVLNYNF